MLFQITVAALSVASVFGAPAADEVTSLPGWLGALPSRHYSGYLPVGNLSGTPGHIHYWFIESENDPANDPVAYWTNGGPGGSGISTGLLSEMGQLQLDERSLTPEALNKTGGVPELQYNPLSWSQKANMLFVSQPKGVGFSFCDDAKKGSDCQNDDLTSAQDAWDFFNAFFAAFPEYASNDFYLTSESYGGIYIPTMMKIIEEQGGLPNLKGAAIGDGCWGSDVGLCAFQTGKSAEIRAEFFAGHAMYSQTLHSELKTQCGDWTDEEVQQKECASALDEMDKQMGSYYVYNIYDECPENNMAPPPLRLSSARSVAVEGNGLDAPTPRLGGAIEYPCGGDEAAGKWLRLEEVQKALHVDASRPGMSYTWGPSEFSGDLRPTYKKLAQKYRMLIYSGDVDGCVPYWGTEEWVRELGFDVKQDWHAWKAATSEGGRKMRAGYVVDYDTGDNDGKISFLTVRGAGHMVPQHQPGFALEMFSKYLADEPF